MDTIIQLFHPSHPFFYVIIAWSLIWKGIALWHAARHQQLIWFIVLFIVNTVSILEIIYLLFMKPKTKGAR
ncbi:DUF5652 family protein [Alteribacillus iranensis]|uniref:DUF5652 domain-containing protein n=1 Tax=Alteribacillus iranensis TaxID=930128 RepID=A0A1I2BUQ5_9BACI|nr:DUF5652 family protein [Alteribacillus iranensis]SFE59787.1 hypothetical protein SAMN05192532_102516 [Alteribacillus iranensis]